MAMFENFPYTDMHALNLDWIIKIAKDFLDQYTHLQELITNGEESLQNLTTEGIQQLQDKADTLEGLLNEWYETHSADIADQLADALADLNAWYTQHQNYLDQYLQDSITAFGTAADAKAAQTIASIPDDYTTLSNTVNRMATYDTDHRYPSIIEFRNDFWKEITTYVKYFAVYGNNNNYPENNTILRILGVYAPENAFYCTVTVGSINYNMIKTYETVPTSGIETLELTANTTDGNASCTAVIVVDWSQYTADLYKQTTAGLGQNIVILPFAELNTPFIGYNTNLMSVPKNKPIIGTFTLNAEYPLRDGDKLIAGGDTTIAVTSRGQLTMRGTSIIDGINFVGDWEYPTRVEEGDHYVPLITEEQLASENSEYIYGGAGLSPAYSVIFMYDAQEHTTVRNCQFTYFKRPCITVNGGNQRTCKSGVVENNSFKECWHGVVANAQFTHIANNTYYGCVIAISLPTGNVCKVGEIIKSCDCGIFYPSNLNNGGHGEAVGIEIAHCGIAGIYIKHLDYQGDMYTGCQFADAPIISEYSKYLLITSGKLDTYVKITDGVRNAITNNIVSKDYIYNNPLYDAPLDSVITNNIPMRNLDFTDVNWS